MAELAQLARSIRGVSSRIRRPASKQRYMAFLSYSHRDSAIADWLHESLEQYRVPARLVGQLTDQGVVPKRLTPIFRDRHELAASPDLGEEIEEAIAASRFLIVLCSPAAARSRWINEEIDCFKRLHREDRVLACILDGEPFASDIPGREAEECFPEALRIEYDGRGQPTGERAEPVAADLREEGDGRRMALLKLAAGMLGVGLDDLAQREAQRRYRRMTYITAASVAGMLFTSGLAYVAFDARDEARDQRRQAEGLIGFMLGDLRQKLEPVGRLDVLDSVGGRALAYYEGQDKSDLPDDSLAQRSRALTLMGEMAQARGDLNGALRHYREAMASTAELARRNPDNPQHLFDHAQNVFWVGAIDYQRGDLGKTATAWREYRRLADRMIALAPKEDRYRLERIYADTNLGTVLMDQRRFRDAAEVYQGSLNPIEELLAKAPGNSAYQTQLIELLAWLADAREFSGQLDEAEAHRRRQLDLLAQQWQQDDGNVTVKRQEMTARRALARLMAERGKLAEAQAEARRAAAVIDWLSRAEPANTEWAQASTQAIFERAELELLLNQREQARATAQAACAMASRLIAQDRSVAAWRGELQFRCLKVRARIALRQGQPGEATAAAQQALVLARREPRPVDRAFSIAAAEMILGDALRQGGQAEAAKGAYERALAAWPRSIEEKPRELAERGQLLRRLGRTAEAAGVTSRLNSIGYRQPVV